VGDYTVNVSDGSDQYFAWGDNRDSVTNFLFPKGRNDPDVFLPTVIAASWVAAGHTRRATVRAAVDRWPHDMGARLRL
jgi:hypothetical protein